MPSDSCDFYEELTKLSDIRQKLERLALVREELVQDLRTCHAQDENLRDCTALLDELQTERLAAMEVLRQINSDVNILTDTIKQEQNDRQKLINRARNLYEGEVLPLCNEINELRDHFGQERLPCPIVDNRDVARLMGLDCQMNAANPVQTTGIWTDAISTINPYQHLQASLTSGPFFNAALMAAVANLQQPAVASNARAFGMNPMLIGAGANAGNVSPLPVTAAEQSGGPAAASGNENGSTPLALTKQQAPPMKICSSCQQQIHRNAPICPLCKSKSRSRHPKKQKPRNAAAAKSDE